MHLDAACSPPYWSACIISLPSATLPACVNVLCIVFFFFYCSGDSSDRVQVSFSLFLFFSLSFSRFMTFPLRNAETKTNLDNRIVSSKVRTFTRVADITNFILSTCWGVPANVTPAVVPRVSGQGHELGVSKGMLLPSPLSSLLCPLPYLPHLSLSPRGIGVQVQAFPEKNYL